MNNYNSCLQHDVTAEFFAVFIFAEWKRDARTTPPTRWWPCPTCMCNRRNDTERWSEASLCNKGLLFLLCGGLSNYKSIKTARQRRLKTGLLNRRFSTADLDFDNFRASLMDSLVLYARVNKRIRLFQKLQGNYALNKRAKIDHTPKTTTRRLFGSTCTWQKSRVIKEIFDNCTVEIR